MRRTLRGLGALVFLIGALIAMPWALWHIGAQLVPDHITRTGITRLLATPDSTGAVLVWLITLVCWICWAIFAICLLVEIVNLASGHRLHLQLPGLAGPQRLTAALLLAVVALVATPLGSSLASAAPTPSTTISSSASATTTAATTSTTAAAPATTSDHTPAAETTSTSHTNRPERSTARPAVAPVGRQHVVTSGQTLWSLAEHYYGDGGQYDRIARANHLEATTMLHVGQNLVIPGVSDQADGAGVTVAAGDTLSSLAEQYLGDAGRWHELWQTNRQVIGADPDEVPVGVRLILPTTSSSQHATTKAKTTTPSRPPVPAPAAPSTRHASTQPGTLTAPPASTTHPASTAPASTGTPTIGATASATASPSTVTVAPAPVSASQTQPSTGHPAHHDRNMGVLAGIGLLLTAGLVNSINQRRRRQLHERVKGQRLITPTESAQRTETVLRARAEVLTITHLDDALRSIAAYCLDTGAALPVLSAARVADDRIDLLLAQPARDAPTGVEVIADGSVWTLQLDHIGQLLAQPHRDRVAPPYPTLVTLGRDEADAHILIDLETAAALTISSNDPEIADQAITGIALELSMAPWSADMNLTLVGDVCPDLDTALQAPTVTRVHDVDDLLRSLTERAELQRHLLNDQDSVGQNRTDPDIADGWCPELILLHTALTPAQADQLADILTRLPRVAIAAVTTAQPAMTEWTYTIADGAGRLQPHDWRITPQLVDQTIYRDMLELLTTSSTPDTTDAPWWDHDADTVAADTPGITEPTDADNQPDDTTQATITRLDAVRAPLSLDNILATPTQPARPAPVSLQPEPDPDADPVDIDTIPTPTTPHPMLRIIGPVDLVGAHGEENRSPRRCQELLLYIHLHPGKSAQAISEAVCTSRTTVKSTLTYLRRWLGTDDQDTAYLEAGGSDGYRLDPRVTTDWDMLQQLVTDTVQHTSTTDLIQALKLVRGIPFSGVRGEFSWTESEMLGIHITSLVTDIALVLTDRALDTRDIPLARWAASTALQTDPQSEALLTARARTEYVAGNVAEVTRLVDRIQHNARAIGMDLCEDTVTILETIEVAG